MFNRPPTHGNPDSPEQALAAHMRSRPGITLTQAQAWLLAEHGVQLSTGATWNAVHRLGLSFKKRMARPVCKGFYSGGN